MILDKTQLHVNLESTWRVLVFPGWGTWEGVVLSTEDKAGVGLPCRVKGLFGMG